MFARDTAQVGQLGCSHASMTTIAVPTWVVLDPYQNTADPSVSRYMLRVSGAMANCLGCGVRRKTIQAVSSGDRSEVEADTIDAGLKLTPNRSARVFARFKWLTQSLRHLCDAPSYPVDLMRR